jgi:hypothetical protein
VSDVDLDVLSAMLAAVFMERAREAQVKIAARGVLRAVRAVAMM